MAYGISTRLNIWPSQQAVFQPGWFVFGKTHIPTFFRLNILPTWLGSVLPTRLDSVWASLAIVIDSWKNYLLHFIECKKLSSCFLFFCHLLLKNRCSIFSLKWRFSSNDLWILIFDAVTEKRNYVLFWKNKILKFVFEIQMSGHVKLFFLQHCSNVPITVYWTSKLLV